VRPSITTRHTGHFLRHLRHPSGSRR
jgi:hypothetical protein